MNDLTKRFQAEYEYYMDKKFEETFPEHHPVYEPQPGRLMIMMDVLCKSLDAIATEKGSSKARDFFIRYFLDKLAEVHIHMLGDHFIRHFEAHGIEGIKRAVESVDIYQKSMDLEDALKDFKEAMAEAATT